MKKLLIPLSVTALFLFGSVLCFVNKDTVIMYHGIRAFRSLSGILIGALSAGGAVSAITGIKLIMDNRARLNEIVVTQQALEDKQRQIEEMRAGLSVKGEIDPLYIRDCLNVLKTRWDYLSPELDDCVHQFEQMDEYQARFSKLLSDNGARTLSDTEDVINQVEQYMCKNARNVINFMNVADPDAKELVMDKLRKCQDENQSLLKQTRDFIYAMADFLNDQGGKADTRLLESYKETLLKTIRKDTIL